MDNLKRLHCLRIPIKQQETVHLFIFKSYEGI